MSSEAGPSPNPRDARDLARAAGINGDVTEDTLLGAWEKVLRKKQQSECETERELWRDAEQALLWAIGQTRRRQA